MKRSIRIWTAAIMAASLAACGGSSNDDNEDSGSGGSGSGGGNGGGSGGAALTTKQVQWYGHEAAFTGVSLTSLAHTVWASTTEGSLQAGVSVQLDCDYGGSFSRVANDLDGNGKIGQGDTIDLKFEQCDSMDGLLNGPAQLTVGEDALDEQAETATFVSAVSFGSGFLVDDTQLSGGFTIKETFHLDTETGLVLGRGTFDLSMPEVNLVSSFAGSSYATKIANFRAAFSVYDDGLDSVLALRELALAASGSDPVLGDGYSYEATVDPDDSVSFSRDLESGVGSFHAGTVDVVARGETVKVVFSFNQDLYEAGNVTFTSTGGVNSTLSYAEFDDLAP